MKFTSVFTVHEVCFSKTLNMDIVHVILLMPVIEAAGLYYESSSETTWYNATRICNIALPDINVQESGNYIDTEYHIRNDKVWVGYFSKTTSFEYIGCISSDNLSITKTLPNEKNSPGLCYTMCRKTGNDLPGISGGKCYCLGEIPKRNKRQPHCNLTCAGRALACGGDSYISLYKVREDISPEKERCYTFQSNKWSGWKRCSETYQGYCIKNNNIYDENYRTWNAYTNTCFSNSRNLVTLNDIQNISDAEGPSWTNIVSSKAYYTYKDFFQGQYSAVKCGYVTRDKVLKFDKDGRKQKNVLCSKESSSTSPTYSTDWSSETMPAQENHTDIGVPIGISVAVLVLVVCGLLAFLYKRKSGNIAKCCMKATTMSDSERSRTSGNVKKTYANNAYDQSFEAVHTTTGSQEGTVVNIDNYAHTYMVLEDVDSQPVDEDSAYNTTTATAPRFAEAQDINVYNKLELERNATYDGVHTTQLEAKGHDETYNTLSGATYAHTTSPKGSVYTTDEDTYNHTSSNQPDN